MNVNNMLDNINALLKEIKGSEHHIDSLATNKDFVTNIDKLLVWGVNHPEYFIKELFYLLIEVIERIEQ